MYMSNYDCHIVHRAEEASVAPSEMGSNQDGHRSDKDKGPLDLTAIYAMPDKKKKLDKQSPASLESVFGKMN